MLDIIAIVPSSWRIAISAILVLAAPKAATHCACDAATVQRRLRKKALTDTDSDFHPCDHPWLPP